MEYIFLFNCLYSESNAVASSISDPFAHSAGLTLQISTRCCLFCDAFVLEDNVAVTDDQLNGATTSICYLFCSDFCRQSFSKLLLLVSNRASASQSTQPENDSNQPALTIRKWDPVCLSSLIDNNQTVPCEQQSQLIEILRRLSDIANSITMKVCFI